MKFINFVAPALPGVLRMFCLMFLTGSIPHFLLAEEYPIWQKIGEGAYWARASREEANAQNGGFISNLGVIVTPAGLVLVGSGPSYEFAKQLEQNLMRRFHRKIKWVVNLYAGPEHVLGNGYFSAQKVPIFSHASANEYMRANCDTCLKNSRRQVGVMPHTKASLPTQLLQLSPGQRRAINFGGRKLEFLYFGETVQEGALVLWDEASAVLFTGRLAAWDCVPEAEDAHMTTWLSALEQLAQMPAVSVVPDCGDAASKEYLKQTEGYLTSVDEKVKAAYEGDVSLFSLAQATALPEYQHWSFYDSRHARNAQRHFLQLEFIELQKN